MNWSEVTAVFGGAFDPPHLGHREAVIGLFKHPGVGKVRIIPTGTPALKTAQTQALHRLAMTKIAFAKLGGDLDSRIIIDDREVRSESRTPSYTFHTLQELRKEGAQLAFVLGVDQVESLDQWHRFPELLSLAHWIALERRPGGSERMQKAIQRLTGLGALTNAIQFLSVPTPARAISSTEIRREFAINGGKSPLLDNNLDPAVRAYLNANHLYGT